jgi:hypothetical protein
VPVFTQPFADVLDRHLTYWRPTAQLPRLVVDHPIQNVADRELALRVDHIVAGVLALLPE